MLVIAIVGHPSSGKDTAAEYLQAKGFVHVASGDRIREDMQAVGVETTRENMNRFSAEQRQKHGLGYPADEIVKYVKSDTVISGLRNRAEIDVCRKVFGDGFALFAVDAPQEIRFERAKARGRIGDEVSLADFQRIEEKERDGSDFHEVDALMEAADYPIDNGGTREELFAQIDAILDKERSAAR